MQVSCGCFQKENAKYINYRHGYYKTPEYRVYNAMLGRCGNPENSAYKNYGGRGIKVCSRWSGYQGFENFYNDMGERPFDEASIERVDVNGNYCPENCKWIHNDLQSRNRRVNKNNSSGVKGVTKRGNKYIAQISVGKRKTEGRGKYLGSYDTLQGAAEARKKAENKYFKEEEDNA